MSEQFEKACLLYKVGRWELAEREFRGALAADPDYACAHAQLAGALAHQNRNDEALDAARMAVGLAPDDAYVLQWYAFVLAWRNEYDACLRVSEEALRIAPDDADVRNRLCEAHFRLDSFDSALEACEAGLSLDPSHVDCAGWRGWCLFRLGRTDEVDDAVRYALGIDPQQADQHELLGCLRLEQDRPDEAVEHLTEALRIAPEDQRWSRENFVPVLRQAAWHTIDRREFEHTQQFIDEALRLEPDSMTTRCAEGELHRLHHRLTQAMSCFERVMASDAIEDHRDWARDRFERARTEFYSPHHLLALLLTRWTGRPLAVTRRWTGASEEDFRVSPVLIVISGCVAFAIVTWWKHATLAW